MLVKSACLVLCIGTALLSQVVEQSIDEQFAAAVKEQQRGQLEQARHHYEALQARAPERIDILSNLGLVYGQLGNYPQAIALFQRALRLAPGESNIRLNLAMTYLQLNRYAASRTEAEQVVAAQPSSALAHYVLGLSLLKLNELALGTRQLEMVVAAQPGNLRAASTLASAYMKAHDFEKAGEIVKSKLSHSDTADAHLVAGTYFLVTGDARDAVRELQRAQQLNPALSEIGSTLAEAYALTGDSEAAQKFFTSEVHSDPTDFEANAFLGWLYLEKQDLEKAQEYLLRAQTFKPTDPAIRFQLARLARAQNEYERAAALLQGVIADQPQNAPAHVLLAQTYLKLKRPEEAKREREIANELNTAQQERQAVAPQSH